MSAPKGTEENFFEKVGRYLLDDPFILRTNGDEISSGLKAELRFLSMLLLLQFFVDAWAWGSYWKFSFGGEVGSYVPVVLGFVFAMTIAIIERFLIIAAIPTNTRQLTFGENISRYRLILVRTILTVMIGLITSIPVELRMFHETIEQRLEDKSKAELDRAVDEIEATIRQNWEKNIESVTAEETRHRSALEAAHNIKTAQTELENKTVLDGMRARLVKLEGDIQREVSGRGMSGIYGDAVVTRTMRQQYAALQAELVETEGRYITQADTENRQWTIDLQTQQAQYVQKKADLEKSRDGEIAAMRADLVSKPDEVVAKYGGHFRHSDGILDRYAELNEITATRYSPAWRMQMIARLVMMLIPLIITIKKVFSSVEFQEYYSPEDQLRNRLQSLRKEYCLQLSKNEDCADTVHRMREIVSEMTGRQLSLPEWPAGFSTIQDPVAGFAASSSEGVAR